MRRRLAPNALAVFVALAAPASAADPPQRAQAEAALQAVKDDRSGKTQVRHGREMSLLLARVARGYRSLGAADRRTAEAILARPTDGAADPFNDEYAPGATVSTHCTLRFCFHWVSAPAANPDAPDLTDSGGV